MDNQEYRFLKGFYCLNLFFIINIIVQKYNEWIEFRPVNLIEILFWFHWLPHPEADLILMAMTIVIQLLGIIYFEKSILRVLVFFTVLIFYGRYNLIDHIDHNYYFIIYPLAVIVFPFENKKKSCLSVGSLVVFVVLLPFTLSGLNKLFFGIYDLFWNQTGVFSSIWSFHNHVAKEAVMLNKNPEGVNLLLKLPRLFYVLFVVGIFFEIASAFVVLRTKWMPFVLIGFIFFQLLTKHFMDIFFTEALLVVIYSLLMFPQERDNKFPSDSLISEIQEEC